MLVEKSFDTGEVVLNYAEGPNNGPPLVMLPGGTQRWQSYYLPIITQLQSRWHIYALDHRGHGKSGRTPNQYNLKDYARDIIAFINHLEEKPVLFGHSMGGIIAIGAAAKTSQKLTALILADPPCTVESNHRWVGADFFQPHCHHMIKVIEEGGTLKQIAEKLGGYNPENIERARTLSELDVGVFKAMTDIDQWMIDYDMDSMLRSIVCPTLLIQADEVGMGRAMTDKDVDYIKSVMSDVCHTKIEGVWHGFNLWTGKTNFELVNEIMSYLESLR